MDLIWSDSAGVTAVGPNTTAFMAPLPPGGSVIGVRLHPGAAPPLFGVPAPALRDGRLPAEELWGDAGAWLAEAVAGAPPATQSAPGSCSSSWRSARAVRPSPIRSCAPPPAASTARRLPMWRASWRSASATCAGW